MLNRDIFSRAIVKVKFPDDPFLTLEILDKLGSDIEGTIGDMEYFEITRRNLSKYKSLIYGIVKKCSSIMASAILAGIILQVMM